VWKSTTIADDRTVDGAANATRSLPLLLPCDSGVGHPWRVDRFLEFLRTGTVNGLGVGASAADVRQRFGRPADTSDIKPPIWKYDQTEITFRDGYVVMIVVRVQAHANAVTKMLDGAGVGYEPHSALTYDDQVAYVVGGSGVTLTLDTAQPVARGFAS
jgi:hypothetical protein